MIKLSHHVRQISWSHHLQILGQCKLPEEREFYLRLAVREGWSKRQLERIDSGSPFRVHCALVAKSRTGGARNTSGGSRRVPASTRFPVLKLALTRSLLTTQRDVCQSNL